MTNRDEELADDPQPTEALGEDEFAPLPDDMANRAGLRSVKARGDEWLHQRPVEILARLARVTRLCAITDALIFPEHPGLRARWDKAQQRYVSATSGKPVDCISIRDRLIYLHRQGEPEPTSVVALRKPEDIASLLLLVEELDKFRTLSSVRVAQNDLDLLTAQLEQLGAAVTRLTVVPPLSVPSEGGEDGSTEPLSHSRDEEPPPTAPLPPPPPPVVTPAREEPRREPRTWREAIQAGLDLDNRDMGSLLWLSLAGVVSFGTTWHGATALGLRAELAFVGTTFVCGFLWTLLAGLAMKHDPLRKHSAEAVFALICVYCGFFTYYEGLTRDEQLASSTERAERAHSDLVAQVYTTHAAELAALRKEAAEVERQKQAEITDGSTGTGVRGYGPRAKQLAAEAGQLARRAATLEGQLAPLEAVVHQSPAGMTPDDVHLLDVQIWSAAPQDWRSATPPARDVYIDTDRPRSPILLPAHAVSRQEPEAYVALVCAGAIEGMMIWCGMAIERRKRERLIARVTKGATRLQREVKDARASWRAAREAEAKARYHVDPDDLS